MNYFIYTKRGFMSTKNNCKENSDEDIEVSHINVLFDKIRFIMSLEYKNSPFYYFILTCVSFFAIVLLIILSSNNLVKIDNISRIILNFLILFTWFIIIIILRNLNRYYKKKKLENIWLHNESVVNSIHHNLSAILCEIRNINLIINNSYEFDPLDEIEHKLTKLLYSIPIFPITKVILPSQRKKFEHLKFQAKEITKTCKRLLEVIELKKKNIDLKLLNNFKISEWEKSKENLKQIKSFINTNKLFFERINYIISEFTKLKSIDDLNILKTKIENKIVNIPKVPSRFSILKKNLSDFDKLCKELKRVESLLRDLIVKIDNDISLIQIENKVENIERELE